MFKKSFAAIIPIYLICFAIPLSAQTFSSLKKAEDSLKSISRQIKISSSDSERLLLNTAFHDILNQAVRMPGSFNYPFDSIRTLGKLTSPDGKFRIYNWNVPKSDGTNLPFCVLQVKHKDKDQFDYYDVADSSSSIDQPELQTLDVNTWYGSLYYKIIKNSAVHDGKKYYTLLGWQPKTSVIAEKVIEVLTFDEHGLPNWGAKIFSGWQDGQARRVIFKYSISAKMALSFSEMALPADAKSAALLKQSSLKGKTAMMIVFDRLVPLDPLMDKQYQYYVPEADTYDAFVYGKDTWIFLQGVDARNLPASSNRKK
jgi:hypothetical protein